MSSSSPQAPEVAFPQSNLIPDSRLRPVRDSRPKGFFQCDGSAFGVLHLTWVVASDLRSCSDTGPTLNGFPHGWNANVRTCLPSPTRRFASAKELSMKKTIMVFGVAVVSF